MNETEFETKLISPKGKTKKPINANSQLKGNSNEIKGGMTYPTWNWVMAGSPTLGRKADAREWPSDVVDFPWPAVKQKIRDRVFEGRQRQTLV